MEFENTTDYTLVAPYYDKTRNIHPEILKECFRRIFRQTDFPERASILDAGCGTGQLSAPLIKSGHSVVGVDVSEAMLEVARRKLASGDKARFEVGDVRSLRFQDGTFDAIVASKLFQHVGNWESAVDEIIRVTKDGGLFIYINETGAFSNAVRKQFQALCKERGFTNLYVGINDRSLLGVYLQSQKAEPITIETQGLNWSKEVVYRDALEHLRLKLHSEFWALPDGVYDEILEEVGEWILKQPRGEDRVEKMHPHLKVEVYEVRK